MKSTLRRYLVCTPVLAVLLLASCVGPWGPRGTGVPAFKLSPANDVFDLEKEGLKVLWRQELGQHTASRLKDIYCAGNIVVVETTDDSIHCLDSSKGKWKAGKHLRDGLFRAPVARGETLFLVVANSLYGFDTVSGKLSESFNPRMSVASTPLVHGEGVVLAGTEGDLVWVLPATGEAARMTSIEGPIWEQPVVSGGVLFAAAHEVIALSLEDNLELWRWEPSEPSELSSGLTVHQDSLYVGGIRGYVYALDASSGRDKWKTMANASIVGQPRIAGSKLLVLTAKPSLLCLATGTDEPQKLWKYDGPQKVLAAGAKFLYVLNDDCSVAALSLEDGREMWRHPLPQDCKITGDGARAAFYVANSEGSIVALGELD